MNARECCVVQKNAVPRGVDISGVFFSFLLFWGFEHTSLSRLGAAICLAKLAAPIAFELSAVHAMPMVLASPLVDTSFRSACAGALGKLSFRRIVHL